MRYASQIKPISDLKANMVITQNSEAKAVLQDVASYEAAQETMALLKILALGTAEIAAGQTRSAAEVLKRVRDQKARA